MVGPSPETGHYHLQLFDQCLREWRPVDLCTCIVVESPAEDLPYNDHLQLAAGRLQAGS